MSNVTISHSTKTYPNLPYKQIKDAILGKKYSLSLVFIGAKRAQRLNIVHRNKAYIPDVLSFPLDENTGEIYICLPRVAATAHKYSHSPLFHTGFLFIHGLLHLKGYRHGATMEGMEQKYCKRFLIKNTD